MDYVEIAKWSDIISALLFLAVMVWLWNRYIAPAVLSAQENTNRQLAEAERHRDEAKAALEMLRTEIDGAKRDAQRIRQRAVEQSEHESATTIADAKEAGERALRGANGELERARAEARDRFRDELAEKALNLAHVDAERRVDTALNARLVDRFVASLDRGGRN